MFNSFVYRWTDRLTGKLYVGYHKGTPDDGYVCSGKYMLEEYEKRPEDFEREILFFGTQEACLELETDLLTKDQASSNSHYYNMTDGGGVFITEEFRHKVSKSKKGKKRPDVALRNKNPEFIEKIKKASNNSNVRKRKSEGGKKNRGRKRPDLALRNKRPRSLEQRKKTAESYKRWADEQREKGWPEEYIEAKRKAGKARRGKSMSEQGKLNVKIAAQKRESKKKSRELAA